MPIMSDILPPPDDLVSTIDAYGIPLLMLFLAFWLAVAAAVELRPRGRRR